MPQMKIEIETSQNCWIQNTKISTVSLKQFEISFSILLIQKGINIVDMFYILFK